MRVGVTVPTDPKWLAADHPRASIFIAFRVAEWPC